MKKSFLVTGICGVGKTTLGRALSEKGYRAYDMDAQPKLFARLDKHTKRPVIAPDNTNLAQVVNSDWICDKARMARIIARESSPITFYCGAASNLAEIIPLFDGIFVLTASQDLIRERLTLRTGNSYGKTREVQDWIMTLQAPLERDMESRGAIVIDANRPIDLVARDVIDRAAVVGVHRLPVHTLARVTSSALARAASVALALLSGQP
jgi:dephospho-CoA kinase